MTGPLVFDADGDYRTCPKCRHVIPAGHPCQRCELIGSLLVERFKLSPQQRRRQEIERAVRGKL